MRPSAVLEMKRIAVREAVGRFRTANPRVFGSVLHGTDQDVDLVTLNQFVGVLDAFGRLGLIVHLEKFNFATAE